jgi:membrane-bound lytic murein transglycosylase MltF
MANHYKDSFSPNELSNSRKWGAASSEVKNYVFNRIIDIATEISKTNPKLTQDDITNLIAIAYHESGFNPSAATKVKISSAAGVFQCTDESAIVKIGDVLQYIKT